jgi:5-(hydroxymethyl)furfural/furfural oxidase
VIVSAGHDPFPGDSPAVGVGLDDGLRVGANLKDHAATAGFEIALKPDGCMPSPDAPVWSSMLRYTSGLTEAGPIDIQMLWCGAVGPTEDTLVGGRLMGAVMRVFLHGEVRLRSDEPLVDPVVEFDMLSDDPDRGRLRDFVRRMIDVVRQPDVESISDGVLALVTPIDELNADDASDRWFIETVNDYVNAVGTCRMGTPGDPAAVVDTDCRVIGYEQLLVCDASIMPDLPKANTDLTTVAIADRLITKMRS